jgi:hypothetical protein
MSKHPVSRLVQLVCPDVADDLAGERAPIAWVSSSPTNSPGTAFFGHALDDRGGVVVADVEFGPRGIVQPCDFAIALSAKTIAIFVHDISRLSRRPRGCLCTR